MSDFHVYEPAAGHGLRHDPLNAIIAPRPIGWISSRGADGVANLAPYSFFNAFNYKPPIIGFASTGWKDSVRNIEATGEFAWNLVTRALGPAMNASSAPVPPSVDEFTLAGLTAAPCRHIAAPRVAESPVAFECRLTQLIRLTDAAGGAIDTWLVLGEVITVHIRTDLLTDGVYDTLKGDPLLRGGGPADYFTLGERVQMLRPGA
ncbi:flavin reductase family protein [Oleisolibacter albus]|uniref:flavin reductase family protein n=1 Tax=Oleisolibacter albus TaxID=2171757 RepID=UPI000DF3F1C9|nr:flavin reductase family protein [Oleisolibacter albus]